MLFDITGSDTQICGCGGTMMRVRDAPQSVQDQCESADDTFFCPLCGDYQPADSNPFIGI